MRTPGTPGTGITGAKAGKSLGSDDQLLSHAGSEIQCRYRLALYLDREADALLFLGRHAAAERLSHQALALRAALQLHLVPFVIGRDGDRTTVIAKCRAWVCDQPELMAALPDLRGRNLACFCAPVAWHGDVLLELAMRLPRRAS